MANIYLETGQRERERERVNQQHKIKRKIGGEERPKNNLQIK
jgi:hypothetical protein